MEATNDPQSPSSADHATTGVVSARKRLHSSLLEGGGVYYATVEALKAEGRFGDVERGQAIELLSFTETPIERRMVEAVLGGMPMTPAEVMGLLTFPVLHKAEALRRMRIVAKVTGKTIDDPALWLARLQRGAKISVAQRLVWRMWKSGIPAISPNRPPLGPEEVKLSNAGPVLAALKAGRNVILLGYHSLFPPLTEPLDRPLVRLGIPKIVVANTASSPGPGKLYINPLQPDAHLQFAKVAKALRRGGPNLVTIYPDGGMGRDFRHFDLGGSPAPVALGASSLAFQGKAACFLALPRISGPRVSIRYLPACDVQASDTRQEVEDRVTDAYRDGFFDILRGDPSAFDLWECYWEILFRTNPAQPGVPPAPLVPEAAVAEPAPEPAAKAGRSAGAARTKAAQLPKERRSSARSMTHESGWPWAQMTR